MKVLDIKRETLSIDKRVLNGVIKIKIEYKVDDHPRVPDFAGLQSVDNIQTLFQINRNILLPKRTPVFL